MMRDPVKLATQSAAAVVLAIAAGCAGPKHSASPETLSSLSSYPGPAAPTTVAEAPAPSQRAEPLALAPRPVDLHERLMEEEKQKSFDYTVLALFGERLLDEDEWSPADQPFSSNLNFMARTPASWLHWDVTVGYGSDEGTTLVDDALVDAEVKIWEIDLGLATIWNLGVLRPYVGIGAAIVNVNAEVNLDGADYSEDDTTVGGYGRAGLMLKVTDGGGIVGVDVRYLVGTDVSIAGVDTDVDGLQVLASFGWSW